MKRTFSWVVLLLLLPACASKTTVSTAPPGGTWSGDYGPDAERRESIRLDLTWEGENLRGVVHTGFRDLPVEKVSFKPDAGTIAMEFEAQGNNGQAVHYIIEGKVEGDAMSGTWIHDSQRGDFRLRKR